MAQIRWTTREWQQIAERLAVNEVVPTEHGWLPRLLDAMKAVLPKERWRDAGNLNDTKKKLVPLMKNVPKHVPPLVTSHPVPTLTDFSTEAMITEIVRRAVTDITEQVKALVALQLTPQVLVPKHKHNPYGPETRRCHKPKVLVVGPRNGQQKELEQAHGEWLDLSFVASESNPAFVRATSGWTADHVVLWTNFISHAHQEQAKKLSAKLHYATGGMSTLHEVLGSIAS